VDCSEQSHEKLHGWLGPLENTPRKSTMEQQAGIPLPCLRHSILCCTAPTVSLRFTVGYPLVAPTALGAFKGKLLTPGSDF